MTLNLSEPSPLYLIYYMQKIILLKYYIIPDFE